MYSLFALFNFILILLLITSSIRTPAYPPRTVFKSWHPIFQSSFPIHQPRTSNFRSMLNNGVLKHDLYQFPMAALINYCKLVDLKHQKFIFSHFWSPEVQNPYHWAKIKMLAGQCFFWRLQGRVCFLASSSFWVTSNISWLVAASLKSLFPWSH